MKRFGALLLSLVMGLMLLSPSAALAAGAPLWQQTNFESREAFRETFEITQEEYDLLEREAAGLDADAYFRETYGSWCTKEEYMEMLGLDSQEAFYRDQLGVWVWERAYELAEAREREGSQTKLEAMGGVPGRLNVMVEGACVPFPDAAPELVEGRTMVPLRAVMEAMGAQVDWADGRVLCALNGVTLSFTVGQTALEVTEDGTTETAEMEAAPYLKGGVTYVPARFFAETLGYDVFWDGSCTTAVLVDRDAFVARADNACSIYNEVMSWKTGTGDSREGSAAVSLSATVLDSISGDKTYPFSCSAQYLYSGDAVNLSGSLDLSGLAQLMKDQGLDDGEADQITLLLGDVPYAVIASQEGTFFQCAALAGLSGEAPNAWYAGGGASWPELLRQVREKLPELSDTAGGLLYRTAVEQNQSPITLYEELDAALDEFRTVYGNERFARSGSGYVWHASSEEDGGSEVYDWTLTFRPDGGVGMELSMDRRSGYRGGLVTTRLTCSGSGSRTGGNLTLRLQVRNEADVSLTMNWSARTSAGTPQTRPPAGAVVVE